MATVRPSILQHRSVQDCSTATTWTLQNRHCTTQLLKIQREHATSHATMHCYYLKHTGEMQHANVLLIDCGHACKQHIMPDMRTPSYALNHSLQKLFAKTFHDDADAGYQTVLNLALCMRCSWFRKSEPDRQPSCKRL